MAGRRILAPLIKVRVLAAQPLKLHSASPSSSRPRTTAFHAVDRGSNPLGDANEIMPLREIVRAFFVLRHFQKMSVHPSGYSAAIPTTLSQTCYSGRRVIRHHEHSGAALWHSNTSGKSPNPDYTSAEGLFASSDTASVEIPRACIWRVLTQNPDLLISCLA